MVERAERCRQARFGRRRLPRLRHRLAGPPGRADRDGAGGGGGIRADRSGRALPSRVARPARRLRRELLLLLRGRRPEPAPPGGRRSLPLRAGGARAARRWGEHRGPVEVHDLPLAAQPRLDLRQVDAATSLLALPADAPPAQRGVDRLVRSPRPHEERSCARSATPPRAAGGGAGPPVGDGIAQLRSQRSSTPSCAVAHARSCARRARREADRQQRHVRSEVRATASARRG